jgi:hypothetical protein
MTMPKNRPKQPRKRSSAAGGRGRSNSQSEVLHRTFGDLEIGDAESDVRVSIIPPDVKGATRGDPTDCAIAHGLRREFHSSAAVVFKTIAYVDILGEDGVRRVERFCLSAASRAVVEAFDRGEPVPADGRHLVLKAPSPGRTLDASLKSQRKRRTAIQRGTYTPNPAIVQSARNKARDLEVRSGSGQWQMALDAEKAAA